MINHFSLISQQSFLMRLTYYVSNKLVQIQILISIKIELDKLNNLTLLLHVMQVDL